MKKRVITSSMDRSRPCSHHHHHHHHHHHCRHHHHHHHCCRHFFSPCIAPLPSQYPQSTYYFVPQIDLNLQPNSSKPTPAAIPLLAEEEPKQNELDNGDEEDVEDDPIFVLTDEWREFFAKSEAKRKLEKQQAKKKNKQSRSGKTENALSS